MTLRERIKALKADEGVSPVIAVILMVAITVVLAATVYVWVSGFASEQEGPEQASATANGVDLNDDGDVEWIKVTLTSGENAPYNAEDVTVNGTDGDGAKLQVCENAKLSGGDCSDEFAQHHSDQWEAGENLWVPCKGSSSSDTNHVVSASVAGTTILDATITCEANAS